MLFRRMYDDALAQASYLVGCQATGEAVVVDPDRDVEQYVRAAAAEGLRITHVTETHIHADFVSGARELAARTGATLLLSAEGGAEWSYAFAAESGARLLRDGDAFMVGNVRFDVVHTPGHTPEHLSFLVTDTPATRDPIGMLTGDFLFVGDVGRPDLLERAAHVAGTMESSARALFHSLRRLAALPDHLQIWPGHGAGSACGKALGAVPQSTLGYERLVNWGLRATDEETFVRQVLAGQPEPPRYFAEMKRINRDGPAILGRLPQPPRLPAHALEAALDAGAVVVDTRPAPAFADGHVPGTLHVPLGRNLVTWVGSLVPYDRDVFLIAGASDDDDAQRAMDDAARELAMIGMDRVRGWFDAGAIAAWPTADRALATVPRIDADALAEALARGDVAAVDVRGAAEWEAGHLPGVPNVPLGDLADRADELPRDRPLVVHCQSGARSAVAASVLQARGLTNVVDLAGGFAAWERAGLPVERPAAPQLAGVA